MSNRSSSSDPAAQRQAEATSPYLADQPLPAISGVPKITQIRNGAVVATYSSLGEAFARTHAFRRYETGDVYELDAAVYSGDANQAWIGPLPKDDAEYSQGDAKFLIPTSITIRGKTQNGVRPVVQVDRTGISYNTLGQGALYVERVKDLTIENIDFDGGGTAAPPSGKAGVYLNGANGFTFRNSRVRNFNQANGVFSTENNSGQILFENIETAFNGGDSGPEHNYYMAKSATDANFKVTWRSCFSHDVYYGHTLKSRAQNNLVEATHLKGKRVTTGQGEAYLADFPNGGNVVFRNNLLEKDFSGDNSNGLFFTYAMEGQLFPNASSVVVTNNQFLAHSKTYDAFGHLLSPLGFYYPLRAPTDPSFPSAVKVTVTGNSFEGFEKQTDPAASYRGTAFTEK